MLVDSLLTLPSIGKGPSYLFTMPLCIGLGDLNCEEIA